MSKTTLQRGREHLRDHVDVLYGAMSAIVMALTSSVAVWLAASNGATLVSKALIGIGALSLGAWYAGRIARAIVTHLVPPAGTRLPRLATPAVVPEAWRTLIALPAIVATPERARELLLRLAMAAREHDDPNVRFALLADFADAPTRSTSADAEILEEERRLVEQLNAVLRDERGDRVFVLHRERTLQASDGNWIGWERKRGKLLELHRLLLGRGDTSYRWHFGEFHQHLKAGFSFVYTLDEANWLPPGELLSLLCVANHPANRAQLNDAGRLVNGFAIFQPTVVPASPVARAGEEVAHLDPLAPSPHTGTTWFHFDVLGVGLFKGKGLLDVGACHALLENVFPSESVLQHDPMEGFVARTAEVHDAVILEAVAPGYLSQVQRGHRWLRGTFQMIPWILPHVRGSDGARRANPLRPIHRLFILELALTELGRPASLILLIAGWLVFRAHVILWTVLVFPPLAELLVRLIAALLGAIGHTARRAFRVPTRARGAQHLLWSLGANVFAVVFSLAMLPYEAIVVADALWRATWRMLVSHRHLLDWPSVSRVHTAARRELREYRRVLRACYTTGLLTLAAVAVIRPAHLLFVLPFAVAWISAPSLAAWLDSNLVGDEPQGTPVATDTHAGDLERQRVMV